MISFDKDAQVGIFATSIKDSENKFVHPQTCVPKFYDGAPEFNGIMTISGAYMEGEETVPVETSIPVKVRYMTAKYYLSDSIDGVRI